MTPVPSSAPVSPEGRVTLAMVLVAPSPGPACIPHTSVVSQGCLALKLPRCSSWRQRPWPPMFPADPSHVCVNMGHTQPAGLASCMQSSLADWWLRRARESVSRWRARRGPRARGRLAHLPSPCWRGSLRNSRQRGPLYPTSTSLPLKTPGQC